MVDDPCLHVDAVGKRFGELQAVNQVSLTVRPGTIHAFLGPNGAGKTTTIRYVYRAAVAR